METQWTINTWANATFGTTSIEAAFKRFYKEVEELEKLINGTVEQDWEKIGKECADIYITLCRIACLTGNNILQDTNTKMEINRKRQWVVNEDGTGQHVPGT